MLTVASYFAALKSGALDQPLADIYGQESVSHQRERVRSLLRRMESCSDGVKGVLVSSPGRTELGGNHTDHNHGVVLAAAVNLDCMALATRTEENRIRMRSEGFSGVIEIDLNDLSPQEGEQGTSEALIRGVADGFVKAGYAIGPFDACVSSEVLIGSGLSSSAAFEVCVGQIFNQLYNGGTVSAFELGRIGRRAENLHFGKPCGFMDQLACAVEGVLSIDFKDQEKPVITEVDFDFAATGYQLAVVDTGGSHADLTPDYAAIPDEMTRAAQALGQDFARGLTMRQVMESAATIRKEAGDRGLLRLVHFIEENERAMAQADLLRAGDMDGYLELVKASGDSSWRLLQNCISNIRPTEQGITVALTLTERFLMGRGAWRIQGGGFAGTIQTYVPQDIFVEYAAYMESVFGAGAVVPLKIRKPGHDLIVPAEGK